MRKAHMMEGLQMESATAFKAPITNKLNQLGQAQIFYAATTTVLSSALLFILLGVTSKQDILGSFRSLRIPGGGQQHLQSQTQSMRQQPMAICLVGEARRFELTGPSIQEHLLGAYPHADVFLNVALDHTTHKLTLLEGVPNLAAIQVFAQTPILEKGAPEAVLTNLSSPAGFQGMLQYFNLVEGCLALIHAYEVQHAIQYKWILRSRLDSFWAGRPPPLQSLNPDAYTVPLGSKYGGLNDRLGIGGPSASQVALRRLSTLEKFQRLHLWNLNSERAFEAQLVAHNITVNTMNFPFCVLSNRRYSWPPVLWSVPVVSMASTAPLNGAKCRPCTPRATGKAAEALLEGVNKDGGWPGVTSGVDLCDASEPWEQDWEGIYAKLAGGQAWAAIEKSISKRSFNGCITAYRKLEASRAYQGPPAGLVCQLASWGATTSMGTTAAPGEGALWPVHMNALSSASGVYTVRVQEKGGEASGSMGCPVHATKVVIIDGARISNASRDANQSEAASSLEWWTNPSKPDEREIVVQHCLPPKQMAPPQELAEFEDTANGWNSTREVFETRSGTEMIKVMEKLGRTTTIDLLLLDLDRDRLRAVIKDWKSWASSASICQLLIGFREWRIKGHERLQSTWELDQLQKSGFVLVRCLGQYNAENCLLARTCQSSRY